MTEGESLAGEPPRVSAQFPDLARSG